MNKLEQTINKLNQWFEDEQEILDELAHDVAQADSIDEMMRAKASYEVQGTKVDAILQAIKLVNEQN